MRQRGLVGPPRKPRIPQGALPFQARRRDRSGRLELHGRQRGVTDLGQHARCLAVSSQLRRAQRPFNRALGDRKVALRLGEPTQPEQDAPRLACPPERQVRRQRPLEPGIVVPALFFDVFQQLPEEAQRLLGLPAPQRPLRPLPVLDLQRRRHQALAASSTISRARLRLSAVFTNEAATTTWCL